MSSLERLLTLIQVLLNPLQERVKCVVLGDGGYKGSMCIKSWSPTQLRTAVKVCGGWVDGLVVVVGGGG